MATKTVDDVVTRALEIMNVIAPGESADGDVFDIASDAYTALHEDIKTDYADLFYSSRVSWNKGAVPEDYFMHVSGLLAGRLAEGAVKCSESGTARALAAARTADSAIRRRLSKNPNLDRFDDALSPRYNSHNVRGVYWR